MNSSIISEAFEQLSILNNFSKNNSDQSQVNTAKLNEEYKKPLSKMNIKELRDLAVKLGANEKKLYGTSKQSLITVINDLKKKSKIDEDTVKQDNKWVNKGDSGKTHGKFKTKKEADAQRKAMYANGFKG